MSKALKKTIPLKNSCIYIIRHAEKPAKNGPSYRGLSMLGLARSHAMVPFATEMPRIKERGGIHYIFAAKNSPNSERPYETVRPLAKALKKKIHDPYPADAVADLVAHLRKKRYHDKNVLVCWHHEKILELAQELGAPANKLPLAWPGEIFGWQLLFVYDDKGQLFEFHISNADLMSDDVGNDPLPLIAAQHAAAAQASPPLATKASAAANQKNAKNSPPVAAPPAAGRPAKAAKTTSAAPAPQDKTP